MTVPGTAVASDAEPASEVRDGGAGGASSNARRSRAGARATSCARRRSAGAARAVVRPCGGFGCLGLGCRALGHRGSGRRRWRRSRCHLLPGRLAGAGASVSGRERARPVCPRRRLPESRPGSRSLPGRRLVAQAVAHPEGDHAGADGEHHRAGGQPARRRPDVPVAAASSGTSSSSAGPRPGSLRAGRPAARSSPVGRRPGQRSTTSFVGRWRFMTGLLAARPRAGAGPGQTFADGGSRHPFEAGDLPHRQAAPVAGGDGEAQVVGQGEDGASEALAVRCGPWSPRGRAPGRPASARGLLLERRRDGAGPRAWERKVV